MTNWKAKAEAIIHDYEVVPYTGDTGYHTKGTVIQSTIPQTTIQIPKPTQMDWTPILYTAIVLGAIIIFIVGKLFGQRRGR